MKLLSVLLFLIISLGIVAISILIAPDQLSNVYFWFTVGWLLLLSLLNWIVSTFIFVGVKNNTKSTTFGILESLNILVFIYSLISGGILISTWYINGFAALSDGHLLIQVILFIIVSCLSILMFMASKAAAIPENKFTLKEDLIKILKLKLYSDNIDEGRVQLIKDLIEIINYSIPHTSKLNSQENYKNLAQMISSLSKSNNNDIEINQLQLMINLAKNS